MAEKTDVDIEDCASCGEGATKSNPPAGLAEPISLAKAVEDARRFLSRRQNAVDAKVTWVGQGIGIIRCLKNACFEDRKAGVELKKDARALIEKLILSLSAVTLDLTEARGRRYSDILAHYRASELSDDKTLAQEFESCRAEYLKDPTNGAVCNRYGWMLHDCLKAAYDRLHNAKLTEFFRREFESWCYQGPDQFHDAKLDKCRERDIKQADAFLNGPREALVLLAAGEWTKAKKAAEAYLASNPGNASAFEVLLKSCEKSTAFEDAVAMVNAASDAIRWHPNEISFQRWFVHASKVELDGIFSLARQSDLLGKWNLAKNECAELVRQCCSDFPRLSLLQPGTWEYSQILFVVVAASERIFFQRSLLTGVLAELTPMVVGFVRAWGLKNLRPADTELPSADRRRRSLAERTVLVLLKCCEFGGTKEDLDWTLHVAEEFRHLFKRDWSDYLNSFASLYHARGDEKPSRRYAIDLVRCDQTEGWRWRVLARTYPEKSQERADCLSRAKSNEAQGDLLANRRAEQLLQNEASNLPGIIQTRFTDKVSQADVVRVWWRDPRTGSACSDFARLADMSDLETLDVGTPVTVSVVEVGTCLKAVGVAPRSDGTPWDIYPFSDAIVVVRNDARHFMKLMYGDAKTCSADFKKVASLSLLQVGDFCQVAVWERKDQPSVALTVRMPDGFCPQLPFCREYHGDLRRLKGSRDGIVDDVVVPPEARGTVHFGTQVRGLAVRKGTSDKPAWRAVVCKPFNDLEVLQ